MLALSGAVIAMLAAVPATAGAAYTAPTSVDFGSLPVGTTSAPQTVTLTSDCSNLFVVPPPICLSGSTTDLVNVSPGTTGDFAVTTTCPAGLAPLFDGTSQSCPLDVTFTPTAGGTRTGTLNTGTTGIGGLTPGPTVSLTGTGLATPTSAGGAGTTPTAKKCKKKKKSRSAASAKKRKCKKKKR
jgi:cytochrome c